MSMYDDVEAEARHDWLDQRDGLAREEDDPMSEPLHERQAEMDSLAAEAEAANLRDPVKAARAFTEAFTSPVPTHDGGLAEKAHTLLEQKRILLSEAIPGARRSGTVYAYVIGDNEPYVVTADNDAVRCSCWAARMGNDCAHRVAAMIAWAEQA